MRVSVRSSRLALAGIIALAAAACANPNAGAGGGAGAEGAMASSCDPLGSGVVAEADGIKITGTEVDQATAGAIFGARRDIFETKQGWVQNEIAKRLITREAQKEGLTMDEFLEKKVESTAKAVTDAEVQMFYSSRQKSAKPGDPFPKFDEVKEQIKTGLEQRAKQDARGAYISKLIESSNVKFHLTPPDPPRVEVSVDDDPMKGSDSAPVTIVEFSDFQCPACRTAENRLPEVLKQYEGKVKLVYRDYPLMGKHPDALPASVAAGCARDQGKYWEFHEAVFKNQSAMKASDLRAHAELLKLDLAKFDACVADPKRVDEVKKDMADADAYGVNSTPTFFVNGWMVPGANVPEISRLIERELKNAGS